MKRSSVLATLLTVSLLLGSDVLRVGVDEVAAWPTGRMALAMRQDSLETTESRGDTTEAQVLVERGLEVYLAQYCGLCHQLDAAKTAGIFGPTHNGMGEIARLRLGEETYAGSATTAEEYLRESIVDPTAYMVPGRTSSRYKMPSYKNLTEEQIDALVQMLLLQ